MSDQMSQADIDALVGVPNSEEPKPETAAAEPAQTAEPGGAAEEITPPANVEQFVEGATATEEGVSELNVGDYLTPEEVDLLGEVGNMCMGAVATTMYTLLDRRVSITTPRVHVFNSHDVLKSYQTPFVVVEVEYIEGIEGKNLLLLKEYDAILITDLLMGGEGKVEKGSALTELHMSAISEVMNQMIGASATALSKILGRAVNISPPRSDYVEINADVSGRLNSEDLIIKISFNMEIEGLLSSQLLQLMPYKLGRELAGKLMSKEQPIKAAEPVPAVAAAPAPVAAAPAAAAPAPMAPPSMAAPAPAAPAAFPAMAPPAASMGFAPPTAAPYGYPGASPGPGRLVDVRPINYPSFDEPIPGMNGGGGGGVRTGQGMGLVADIPLQVSVELGKAKKTINDILEFGIGTIVVLEKMAGEHVEVMVNGKMIASGEVVVIDENYGVRITDIYD